MPKKKKPMLKAEQYQTLPISIGEARKLLGDIVQHMSDDEVGQLILYVYELAIFLFNNMDLRKMHL